MQALVTGIAGFAGSHLAELLVREGFEVAGLALPGEDLSRLEEVADSVEVRRADICETEGLTAALEGLNPHYVFHLAALASVPASFERPSEAVRVNAYGAANLFSQSLPLHPSKIVHISSADVYGHVKPDEVPLRENRELKPANPYAASKAAGEVIAREFWRTEALPIVILRPFNHTGARQGPGFAPSDFAMAIARIEAGLEPPRLSVGNLSSMRDYSDVRDIARAYLAAALHGEPGEVYNVSSGAAVEIRHILDILLEMASCDIEVAEDPGKMRPSDTPLVVGDNTKFRRRTGWEPGKISTKETLAALLDWWRGQSAR